MSTGAGKYDELCTYVREQADAQAAVVIVLGGKRGSGFSVQHRVGVMLTPVHLAAILKSTAQQLRADHEAAMREIATGIRKEFGFDDGGTP